MNEKYLNRERGILHVCPHALLRKEDLDDHANMVDHFIVETGDLRGLILDIADFPGWENLGGCSPTFSFCQGSPPKNLKSGSGH